ncbi:methionyl-tRNA formyltransferase [Luteipulveratus sp. YIM 133132]|uniref:methionyl-tRNA formyltransferase n=1 Tax=Luteipulveratus flavus TaxID=3031728 RepID=UPI0023AFA153|nr:methionyl-tRNA formyltransferase [Luteipulveratus sp. YIM 133132]MDE9366040.1 methionyl-tRNA formyltransferase [Luteipulveratus sp. YIM 133132]
MRVVFAGTPQVALPSLDALLASRHEVAAVITRPDARAGRGRRSALSPVRARAEEAGLEVLTPDRPSDPQFQQRLRELEPQVCPVVAYGALVPRSALDIPEHGWVNLHFSLLPAWRGAAPVQHAVINGDAMTGATTFVLEEGMDTGPVIGTLTEPVRATDTSGDLLDRLATAGAGLLVASLDAIEEGRAAPVAQPAEGVSMAPKLTVEDGEIRWRQPAFAVDRRVRGCTPAPGAWTTFRGERLKVAPVEPVETADPTLAPGEIHAGKREVLIGTATTPVRLGEVQPPGRRAMAAADWARGSRIEAQEVLGG